VELVKKWCMYPSVSEVLPQKDYVYEMQGFPVDFLCDPFLCGISIKIQIFIIWETRFFHCPFSTSPRPSGFPPLVVDGWKMWPAVCAVSLSFPQEPYWLSQPAHPYRWYNNVSDDEDHERLSQKVNRSALLGCKKTLTDWVLRQVSQRNWR